MLDTAISTISGLAASSLPKVLMLSHNVGGGVARHITELAATLEQQAHVLQLKPCDDSRRKLCLELPAMESNAAVCQLVFVWPRHKELLWGLLGWLGVRHYHVHHVLGWPADFWDELTRQPGWLDLTLHDHCIFGLADASRSNTGATSKLSTGSQNEAKQLLALAGQARRVLVPSGVMTEQLHQSFLDLPSSSLLHRPHPEAELVDVFPVPRLRPLLAREPLRVLCLGMISLEKGASNLAMTARLARQACAPLEFHLLGSCHAALPGNIHRHGSYRDEDIQSLLKDIDPHLLWLPAVYPETWSYTLSAGLRAGLPVMTTDIGVFPERLLGRPLSWLHPANFCARQWLEALLEVRNQHLHESHAQSNWQYQPAPAFYSGQGYIATNASGTEPQNASPLTAWQISQLLLNEAVPEQGFRLWLVRQLLRLKNWPPLAPLVRLIPYSWQRKLKRLITRAPLYEEQQ